jgi:hypothetical protein
LLTVVAVSRVALIHLNQPKAAGIDVNFYLPLHRHVLTSETVKEAMAMSNELLGDS